MSIITYFDLVFLFLYLRKRGKCFIQGKADVKNIFQIEFSLLHMLHIFIVTEEMGLYRKWSNLLYVVYLYVKGKTREKLNTCHISLKLM